MVFVDDDVLTDKLLSTSTNVSLSLIFLATTFEFSISFDSSQMFPLEKASYQCFYSHYQVVEL